MYFLSIFLSQDNYIKNMVHKKDFGKWPIKHNFVELYFLIPCTHKHVCNLVLKGTFYFAFLTNVKKCKG